MITVNEITLNEQSYLVGKIGKEDYSIKSSDKAKKVLTEAMKYYNTCSTMEEVENLYEGTMKQLKEFATKVGSDLESVLGDDLYFSADKGTYHIKWENQISEAPVHDFFVNKMREMADKGFEARPWLVFWVRLMRNPLYINNDVKVNILVMYLEAPYTDEVAMAKRIEDGYGEAVARELSTFPQITITENGLLAAFKYVDLMNDKFEVVIAEETGEQEVYRKDRYTKALIVDEVTGEILDDSLQLPEYSEDIYFQPPVMRNNGDAFSCRGIDDEPNSNLGHIIKVGMVHELPGGFDDVNCDDSRSCVKGLHSGGYHYVQGYGGKSAYMVDCLIAPEDIGAVCDTVDWGDAEGAIRSKRYFVTGAHEHVSRGMYHPAQYGAMLDAEWNEAKKAAIDGARKALKDAEGLV